MNTCTSVKQLSNAWKWDVVNSKWPWWVLDRSNWTLNCWWLDLNKCFWFVCPCWELPFLPGFRWFSDGKRRRRRPASLRRFAAADFMWINSVKSAAAVTSQPQSFHRDDHVRAREKLSIREVVCLIKLFPCLKFRLQHITRCAMAGREVIARNNHKDSTTAWRCRWVNSFIVRVIVSRIAQFFWCWCGC